MDFTQLITLLDSVSSFGDLFKGIGATLTGSADILTGSGNMAEGTAKLVEALGQGFSQDLITGSLAGTGSTGSVGGSLAGSADIGSMVLGSTGS